MRKLACLLLCCVACTGSSTSQELPAGGFPPHPSDDAGAPDASTAAGAAADAGAADSGPTAQSGNGDSPAEDAGIPDGNLTILAADRSAPAACDDSWCWANPLPFGEQLNGVATTSMDDVWVSPSNGPYLRHWNGTAWSRFDLPLQQGQITAVYSISPSDAWAAAGGFDSSSTLFHWDGQAWTATGEIPGYANVFWARGPADVWAGGERANADGTNGLGLLEHFDGSSWTDVTPFDGSFSDFWSVLTLWSPSPGAPVYAGGYGGFLAESGSAPSIDQHDLAFDGSSWSQTRDVPFAGTGNQRWVAGRQYGERWVVRGDFSVSPPTLSTPLLIGGENTLYETQGRTFAVQQTQVLIPENRGDSGGFISEFDGVRFVPTAQINQSFTTIAGNGTLSDVWAVGVQGSMVSFDGHTFHNRTFGSRTQLSSIFAISETEQWAVGQGGLVLHRTGGLFEVALPHGGFDSQDLFSVGGSGPQDVWAGGSQGLLMHYDGVTWATRQLPQLGFVERIFAVAPGDDWFITNNPDDGEHLLHSDQGVLTVLDQLAGTGVNGGFGSKADDVWFSTVQGLRHWDGTQFTATGPSDASCCYSVDGTGGGDVWAVNFFGGVWHFDGAAWTRARADNPFQISRAQLWARSGSDVVLSLDQSFLRLDGGAFVEMAAPPGGQIYSTGSYGPDGTLWLAGTGGAIVRSRPPK
jgi:hypothetical protein